MGDSRHLECQECCFLVESDPDLAALYQERMERAGYDVQRFAEISNASAALQPLAVWPAALLFDLPFQPSAAVELMETISRDPRRKKMSVVVLGTTLPAWTASYDFIHYLPKPLTTPGELAACLPLSPTALTA